MDEISVNTPCDVLEEILLNCSPKLHLIGQTSALGKINARKIVHDIYLGPSILALAVI